MALSNKQTAAGAALIAAILASAGGAIFLHKHPDPTLREVFKGCEAGELHGIVCCEDMNRVKDQRLWELQCGMVAPGFPDPFSLRVREEDEWDRKVEQQKREFVK